MSNLSGMQPAVVLVFADRSGLLHVECAPTLAACLALLEQKDSFLRRYGFDRLVYAESYDRYSLAQARAEQLRQLPGEELHHLVTRHNPTLEPLPAESALHRCPMRHALPHSSARSRHRRRPTILPQSLPPYRPSHDG